MCFFACCVKINNVQKPRYCFGCDVKRNHVLNHVNFFACDFMTLFLFFFFWGGGGSGFEKCSSAEKCGCYSKAQLLLFFNTIQGF